MTYKEVLQAAQGQMGPCRACPVCNGRACGGTIPGPGAKGSGTVAVRNFDAWRNVRLNMDTIHENFEPDTSLTLFGRSFKYPFFAGPVGAMTLHYGDKYNDLDYNNILVPACAAAGIAAFTGDGTNHKVMEGAAAAITACDGAGIPTVKPWDNATVARKIALARSSGCFAMAMDIDAAGLPFLQHLDPPAGSKTVEQLKEIALAAGVPFILKGIMTVKGAEKAIEAGAAGIVVSNHGGRVLDDCPATQEVLADIVAAVDGRAKILVDGGIRTGSDVFKALALGAPYVKAVCMSRSFMIPAFLGCNIEGALHPERRERVHGAWSALPKTVLDIGDTPETIFAGYHALKERLGADEMAHIPYGAIAMWTMCDRLGAGLQHHMAGARKFGVEHIDRTDICAANRETAQETGIPFITEQDDELARRIVLG